MTDESRLHSAQNKAPRQLCIKRAIYQLPAVAVATVSVKIKGKGQRYTRASVRQAIHGEDELACIHTASVPVGAKSAEPPAPVSAPASAAQPVAHAMAPGASGQKTTGPRKLAHTRSAQDRLSSELPARRTHSMFNPGYVSSLCRLCSRSLCWYMPGRRWACCLIKKTADKCRTKPLLALIALHFHLARSQSQRSSPT